MTFFSRVAGGTCSLLFIYNGASHSGVVGGRVADRLLLAIVVVVSHWAIIIIIIIIIIKP